MPHSDFRDWVRVSRTDAAVRPRPRRTARHSRLDLGLQSQTQTTQQPARLRRDTLKLPAVFVVLIVVGPIFRDPRGDGQRATPPSERHQWTPPPCELHRNATTSWPAPLHGAAKRLCKSADCERNRRKAQFREVEACSLTLPLLAFAQTSQAKKRSQGLARS